MVQDISCVDAECQAVAPSACRGTAPEPSSASASKAAASPTTTAAAWTTAAARGRSATRRTPALLRRILSAKFRPEAERFR